MSPICPKAPHPQIYTKFGAAVEVAAVLAYTTFLMLGHGMFILWGGEKCHLPLTKPFEGFKSEITYLPKFSETVGKITIVSIGKSVVQQVWWYIK